MLSVTLASLALPKGSDLSADDEKVLLERFARGDESAFDRIVQIHQPRILRLAARLLGWRESPEDVAQEVFLVAFRKLRRFRGESSLGTWLTSITLRTCRAWRRRWWRQWRRLLRLKTSVEMTCAEEPADDETSRRVRDAVARLPSGDREVIVLYYLEQMSVAAMAEILGASVGAINVRLHRARGRLREKLAGLVEE